MFFLHWSWKIPAAVFERFTCIGFHMTDLPYGRGGSPLQNLIVRGHRETKLTALGIAAAMDTGPIYAKRPLSLAGTAQEIFVRAMGVAAEMVRALIDVETLSPTPQAGEPTFFSRRTPGQSEVPAGLEFTQLYDHLRMLDAETYPRAFVRQGGVRYEFSEPRLVDDGRITAKIKVVPDN